MAKKEDKIIETVKENVDRVAETAKKTADKIAETPTAKKAAETAKKAAEKVAATPEAKAASATAKKAATKAKKTAAAATKAASKEYTKLALKDTYFQFFGKEYKQSEILEKVEEAWKAEGHRVSSIKTLELYVKPEDGAAYYVINAKHTGSVEL